MFHLQRCRFTRKNCAPSFSFLYCFHVSMPLIDLPFTSGTLVGENVSNKIKRKTKNAIIPSRIDIFNATQRLTNVEWEENVKIDENDSKLLKGIHCYTFFGY